MKVNMLKNGSRLTNKLIVDLIVDPIMVLCELTRVGVSVSVSYECGSPKVVVVM